MLKKIEIYLKDVICGRKRGVGPYFLKLILLPISWMYGRAIRIRNWLYDKGWMRRYIPPVPLVVSVGNIVAGGTGKTPVTLLLANALYPRFSIAILSRGYRSKVEKLDHPVVLCEGNGPMYPAAYCGDEPYIFAQRLPKSYVIVGGDRHKASHLAAKAGVQVILLDDGMQHRRLDRDFDVVVVDATDPFGHDYFLPRGFLRDDKKSLSRASLIVLNHIYNAEQFQRAKQLISPYTSAPAIGTCWRVESIQGLRGEAIGSLQGKKIGMFCGIAHPEHFRHTLEREGAVIVAEYSLPDHEKPHLKELEEFTEKCLRKGVNYLVCTEKDRVKLEDQLSLSLPIAWLKMDLNIVEGEKTWQEFLSKAELKIY